MEVEGARVVSRRSKSRTVPLSQDSGRPRKNDRAESRTRARAGPTLEDHIANFLAELAAAGRSAHTLRAYAGDLRQFREFLSGARLEDITPAVLRNFFNLGLPGRAAASRARKQAAVASFLGWAYRHDHLAADPMARLERLSPPQRQPRPLPRKELEKILRVIPPDQVRDRLLFRLILETGLRIAEALGVHVEDLALRTDDERLRVLGKGGRPRTLLLDDPRLVAQLRAYLRATGYTHGLLFRAAKNGTGGPLRYQSVQERWAAYCAKAGVACTLHQLRHSHATELLNGGASVVTVRKRLGQKNLQTTLLYAELSDARADQEVREARRKLRR